jgi:hypothetical protein
VPVCQHQGRPRGGTSPIWFLAYSDFAGGVGGATSGSLMLQGAVDTEQEPGRSPLGSSGSRCDSASFHAWISEQKGYRSPSYPRACQSRPRTTVRTTRLQRHKRRSRFSCYFLPGRPNFWSPPLPDDCELRVRPAHQIVFPVNDPGDVAKNTKDEVTSTLGA